MSFDVTEVSCLCIILSPYSRPTLEIYFTCVSNYGLDKLCIIPLEALEGKLIQHWFLRTSEFCFMLVQALLYSTVALRKSEFNFMMVHALL